MNDVQKLIDEHGSPEAALLAALDKAMQDVLRIKEAWEANERATTALHATIKSQAAQIESLTKDAQRLDFIAANARHDPDMGGQHAWWPTNFNQALRGPTLRAAIDAVIKAKETGA